MSMTSTIALPATLTADTVGLVHTQLLRSLRALPEGAAVVLDAGAVQSFDSAGLALLLACRRTAQSRRQHLQVQGWTSSLQSLAQVYGVLPLLAPELVAVQSV